MTRMIEWPTFGLLAATYIVWGIATVWVATFSVPFAVALVAFAITQHSSLQHEVIHGHPTKSAALNAGLVWPPLILFIPYLRFRDTHLAHHTDCRLTDPYDDPETNFLDPAVWDRIPSGVQRLLLWNNTLAGRMVVGPILGTAQFFWSEWHNRHDSDVRRGWAWHVLGLGAVLVWVAVSPMPSWAYLLSVYGALSLLRVRTFLEHRAHDLVRGRSVIVEDRGPLALCSSITTCTPCITCTRLCPGTGFQGSCGKTGIGFWRQMTAMCTAPTDRFSQNTFCAEKTLWRIRFGGANKANPCHCSARKAER